MVGGKQIETEPQLFHLRRALKSLPFGFGARQRRQQQSGKNRDDCDHHQQLDQSKRSSGPWPPPSRKTDAGLGGFCSRLAAHKIDPSARYWLINWTRRSLVMANFLPVGAWGTRVKYPAATSSS